MIEIEEIIKEGSKRADRKIPPGFSDIKKDGNPYGDYILWKEILDYSESNKVDVIFITQDVKEDWWQIISGKTVGPRYELREEFYERTGHIIHFYNLKLFMEICNQMSGIENDQHMIEEIEAVPVYESDTELSKWKEALERDYNTMLIAEKHSKLLEEILNRKKELTDIDDTIDNIDYLIHLTKNRINSISQDVLPKHEYYIMQEKLEKDLWNLETELAELQSNRQALQSELELLIKHARWD